jgi:endoglycosylceramidase
MYQAFDAFYHDPKAVVRTRFLMLWGILARAFRDNPGVIGYDIINEPFGDEATDIDALYRDAAQVIRAEDPTSILFLEPQINVGMGLGQTRLRVPSFGNVAYAPHYYNPQAVVTEKYNGNPAHLDATLGRIGAIKREWNAPVFLGEFGVGGKMERGMDYLDALFDRLNEHGDSGAQWGYTPKWSPGQRDGWNYEDFSIIDDHGAWRANFRARPYASRVAGELVGMRETRDQDGKTSGFEVSWNQESGGATEIFFPVALRRELGLALTASGSSLHCNEIPDGQGMRCAPTENGTRGRMRVEFHR